ncbi:hypothetical protein [Paenibacillus sp. DCT19]|nr:hypothetical protein [Paenibacillus sp. DCT19]
MSSSRKMGMEEVQQSLYDTVLEEIEQNKGEEYSYDDAREFVD